MKFATNLTGSPSLIVANIGKRYWRESDRGQYR